MICFEIQKFKIYTRKEYIYRGDIQLKKQIYERDIYTKETYHGEVYIKWNICKIKSIYNREIYDKIMEELYL